MEQDCKKRTKSPPERFPGRHAVKILEFLNEMGLVVVAAVVKQLVLAEALLRGFGTEYILKTNDLAERFGRVADVILEKPAELPGAKTGVEVFFDIQHAEVLEDHGQCPVQPRIVLEINTRYPMQEVVVEPAFDLRQRQPRFEGRGDELRRAGYHSIQVFKAVAQFGGIDFEELRKHCR